MREDRKTTIASEDVSIRPTVSVVISSYERHEEVVRAVRSALDQTFPPYEVIVSNDGPDARKGRLLAGLDDDRIRFVEAPLRKSASATRNFGIGQATGDWVAVLDDDDVWRLRKLEAQFLALRQAKWDEAILAGLEAVFVETGQLRVRPSGPVPLDTPVDTVLFGGLGGAHTSTLMAPRWVFERYPFDESLERHEDWTWLLRAGSEMPLIVAADVVCERHLAPGEGLSRPGGFAVSRAWYEKYQYLISPSARARFVADILSRKAAFDGRIRAIPWLIGELRRNGDMSGRNMMRLLLPWLVPSRVRQFMKSRGLAT